MYTLPKVGPGMAVHLAILLAVGVFAAGKLILKTVARKSA